MSPPYKSGMDVLYKNTAHGTIEPARISEVHLDDIEPYYSIRLINDNGREKQTDSSHIISNIEKGNADDKDPEEGCCSSISTEDDCSASTNKTEKNNESAGVDKQQIIRTAPLYKSGMNVYYKNTTHGTIEPARISGVHLDDIQPYYSIRLVYDGREKQTDHAHIMLTLNGVECCNNFDNDHVRNNERMGEREPLATTRREDHDSEKEGGGGGVMVRFCNFLADCF